MSYQHSIPRAGLMSVTAFRRLRDDGMADFTQRADSPRNAKAVTCRVCRIQVVAGEGFGYDEYMIDGYRFNRRYVCANCFVITTPNATPQSHMGQPTDRKIGSGNPQTEVVAPTTRLIL